MTRTFVLSAWAMAIAQIVHGFIPSGVDEDNGSVVGPIGGLILLVLSLVVVYGAMTGRPWSTRLGVITGTVVAVGFVLYHAVPAKTAFSNPYPGEGASVGGYVGVALAVGAAAWCAWEGTKAQRTVEITTAT
jgi:hypothetical protein